MRGLKTCVSTLIEFNAETEREGDAKGLDELNMLR